MNILACLLAVVAGVLLIPVAILLGQIAAAMLPRRTRAPTAKRPRVAVLVPAHNESAGIEKTLRSIRAGLIDGDRILVVADNCADDTARIAALSGAEVVERFDETRRGKGYALDFGVRHLEREPPESVVIVDADCEVCTGAIERISRMSLATGRAVQALYLMNAPDGAGPMAAVAEFAQLIKNHVRPLGFLNLGLPCQLMGTGMAFPWSLLKTMHLASGNLVEDMKMGIDCARAGRPPLFCPEARVVSHFPANREGARSQRTRWEHGHLAMIFSEMPSLAAEALTGRGKGLLPLVLDMCIPPLALLGLAVMTLCSLGAGVYFVSGSSLALQLSLLAAAGLAAAIFMAWLRFGRSTVSLATLAFAPVYVVRKLPIYARFLFRRQVDWVRSRRDES